MKTMFRSFPFALFVAGLAFSVTLAEGVRVFAAASLTGAFREIADLYREQNPGSEVELSFAGSQILRTQIEEGAPADVFASADRIQMDVLRAKGLVRPDSVFARNRLVVVTPGSDPAVHRLADLARPGIRVVIADGNAPVGRYTTEVLGKMSSTGLFGHDFQKRVMANVVSRETNVRAVLAKVSLDEVDAGIVYATDALTVKGKIRTLDIPDSANVIAEYPIAVLAESRAGAAAERFVALVRSGSGQAILAKHGFEPAR